MLVVLLKTTMDFESEMMNDNLNPGTANEHENSDEEEEEEPQTPILEELSSKVIGLLHVNVDEEEDEEVESPVPLDMQMHGQSPKGRVLKRRMSSVFVMKFNRKADQLDAETSEKVNELLHRFPYPPDHLNFQQVLRRKFDLL